MRERKKSKITNFSSICYSSPEFAKETLPTREVTIDLFSVKSLLDIGTMNNMTIPHWYFILDGLTLISALISTLVSASFLSVKNDIPFLI